jgi:lysophospholipase L1-like esterase
MPGQQPNRRQFLTLSTAALILKTGGAGWSAEPAAAKPKAEDGLVWRDVRDWGVEGRGWSDTERYFDRFPRKAKGVVRDAVWSLSRHSAGMCCRFETDAAAIWARYELLSKSLAMPHMPATGVSGLDLYARDPQKRWRWLGFVSPTTEKLKVRLADGIEPGRREYLLYLPLYNGVESLEIGLPPQAAFAPRAPRAKPIVFYGTSITHGGCASRPGMAYPAILGRRLDRPVINLGFSGNGTMDPEVGALLVELDASVYVIDCLPNMQGETVAARTEPLVRQLRAARPKTPIVLVEDRTYTNAVFLPAQRERHAASRAALRSAYEHLKAAGVQGLHYVEGEHLLGDDGEATVDASHPTDLGMFRMADALEPALRPLVAEK